MWRVLGGLALAGLVAVPVLVVGGHVTAALLGLTLVGVLVLGAAYDSVVPGPPAWPEPDLPALPEPDRMLVRYLRVLEDAERSALPEDRVRNLLRQVAGDRLARRHGLAWDSPDARALLGEDLFTYLGAPPQRLTRRRLRSHIERIESL